MSGRLLVIDTATRHAVVALCDERGELLGVREWDSPHRHGEQLLPRLDELLRAEGVRPAELAGVGIGIGPGSFTGLRIGLATAKVIAYTSRRPIVGVSTTTALAAATGEGGPLAVVLPAGTADRYVARCQAGGALAPPQLAPATSVQELIERGDLVVSVDLAQEELGASAAALGARAQAGLAASLAGLVAQALATGQTDELAALVPSYVALPRGVARAEPEVAWSPDLR